MRHYAWLRFQQPWDQDPHRCSSLGERFTPPRAVIPRPGETPRRQCSAQSTSQQPVGGLQGRAQNLSCLAEPAASDLLPFRRGGRYRERKGLRHGRQPQYLYLIQNLSFPILDPPPEKGNMTLLEVWCLLITACRNTTTATLAAHPRD